MTIHKLILTLALAAITAMMSISSPVDAGFRNRLAEDLNKGYVIARSRFGNGSQRGAVRPARYGHQVQLPSGSWVNCRRSCSETLRVETVDFWEGRINGTVGLTQECGIFGCLDFGINY